MRVVLWQKFALQFQGEILHVDFDRQRRGLTAGIGARIRKHRAKCHPIVTPSEAAAALSLAVAGSISEGRRGLIDAPTRIGLPDKIIDRAVRYRDLAENDGIGLQPNAAGLTSRHAVKKRAILGTNGERGTNDFEPCDLCPATEERKRVDLTGNALGAHQLGTRSIRRAGKRDVLQDEAWLGIEGKLDGAHYFKLSAGGFLNHARELFAHQGNRGSHDERRKPEHQGKKEAEGDEK